MILFPRSKVNIGLRVTEKRADGYHNLESLFCDVAQPCDILEIVESDELSFSVYGKAPDCRTEDNICIKAYNLLKSDFNIPGAEIHLYKSIPFGAGLGGGSSDGSGTLILLNKLYNLGLETDELCNLSAKLGSDCPFFIYANSKAEGEIASMVVRGRGDILEPIDIPALNDYFIEIVTPPVFVSTAEAYSGITPKQPENRLDDLLQMPVECWKDYLHNDFEDHIFKKYPLLNEYKEVLYSKGAVYASMSGSGSSIFGLFRKEKTTL